MYMLPDIVLTKTGTFGPVYLCREGVVIVITNPVILKQDAQQVVVTVHDSENLVPNAPYRIQGT